MNLYLQATHPPLTWNLRSKILKDVCKGMTWMHKMCPPIIHGDVKS